MIEEYVERFNKALPEDLEDWRICPMIKPDAVSGFK